MGDREVMEKGSRAFVSLVRGYKEHQCKFVCKLQVRAGTWQNTPFPFVPPPLFLPSLPSPPPLKIVLFVLGMWEGVGYREVIGKGSRAFVSLVRGYKEHHCKFVFRLQVRPHTVALVTPPPPRLASCAPSSSSPLAPPLSSSPLSTPPPPGVFFFLGLWGGGGGVEGGGGTWGPGRL